MAVYPGNSFGICEQDASELVAQTKQMAQNIKDRDAQQCTPGVQHQEQDYLNSGIFPYDATYIANPNAQRDDSKGPSAPSEAEAKLTPQQSTVRLSSVQATQEQQRLLEGTVHKPPGGTVLGKIHQSLPEDQPPIETGESEPDASMELRAKVLDAPDAGVVPLPADDCHTPDTVPSPETVSTLSEYDKAVGIAEKMDPANWPQPADLQALTEEIKKPDNEESCCWGCSICCKCKGKTHEFGYECTKWKCLTLYNGAKSVFQYWTDGFTPRWKLVLMFLKIFVYIILLAAAAIKFAINASQREYIVFDSISFVCTLCGFLVSLLYAFCFCIRRWREVCITLIEMCTWIALTVYKCCCCCCKIKRLEGLKRRHEECNVEHEAAEKYVSKIKTFKPPQNCCQKLTALLGNASEVLLTIVDDVILTAVFILSLYSFVGKQDYMIFHGFREAAHIFSFIVLVLSALKLIFFVHGLRVYSIAVNIRALDKKVERDREVMKLELPNKFIQYLLSFQARLVFHVLLSSTFQLYGIFTLSWKIIQDSCSMVEASSTLVGNWTNASFMSPLSPNAPFTCNIPSSVNGFTVYNILYIAMVPTLLGYTSFFVCNIPWLVEYMQTITMWTYLQIEYTTGHRVREDDMAIGQGEVSGDGEQGVVGRDGRDANLCRVSEKDAYISPVLQLVRIFCGDLLCDVSDEDLRGVGANAEHIRQAIQKDHDTDAKKFGTNFILRAVTMLVQVIFFIPAAIIGALQVVLFIIHLSFLGCCFSSDVHTVFLSVPTDVAAVFIPLVILFLMTSAPGPWMGLLWITVVTVGVVVLVVFVSFMLTLVPVMVMAVALVCLFCCIYIFLKSSKCDSLNGKLYIIYLNA